MAGNYRIHYPIHSVRLGGFGRPSSGCVEIHGLQSVALNTSFNLEQVFELGQLNIYENIETLPEIEMTLEKVIDGYPLIYHLASEGATASTLLNRTNIKSCAYLSIFSDGQDNASGTPMVEARCSGMYINSLTYTFPVEGNSTESVSLVGNDKVWSTTGVTAGTFAGTDTPASGVQRREDVVMGVGVQGSTWPKEIPGINNDGKNELDGTQYDAHIQDVTITANLGREDILELGRRRPFYRYATFPVTIETSINVHLAGTDPSDGIDADADSTANITDQEIIIHLTDGSIFNLGTVNKLSSVSYSGGDSGGGNVVATYTYQNFNILAVTAPHDPDGL